MRLSIMIIMLMLLISLVFPNTSFGCSLLYLPIKEYNPHEYVFIGTVVSIVEPVESQTFYQKAYGLVVKADDPIGLPTSPAIYFEVFPFDLAADCNDIGWNKEKLLKHYPMGAQVRVIATKWNIPERKLMDGKVRLIVSAHNRGSISFNIQEGKPMTSSRTIFNYRGFKKYERYGSVPPYYSNEGLPSFELRKDLLRLEKTKSERKRAKILERLAYYPDPNEMDFSVIVNTYIKSRTINERLNRKRELWNQKRESVRRTAT